MEDILGEIDPAMRVEFWFVCEELICGVDAEELDAGEFAHTLGRDAFMQSGLGGDGAFVAIAEGIGECEAIFVETDVVDSPAVDCDGADAFGGDKCALVEAEVEFFEDVREVPAEARYTVFRALFGVVGAAVD
jgi:hypothetical protein